MMRYDFIKGFLDKYRLAEPVPNSTTQYAESLVYKMPFCDVTIWRFAPYYNNKYDGNAFVDRSLPAKYRHWQGLFHAHWPQPIYDCSLEHSVNFLLNGDETWRLRLESDYDNRKRRLFVRAKVEHFESTPAKTLALKARNMCYSEWVQKFVEEFTEHSPEGQEAVLRVMRGEDEQWVLQSWLGDRCERWDKMLQRVCDPCFKEELLDV